jgi:preprotein translocase subunit SecG
VMFPVLFAASLWHYVFGILIFLTSLFLILLVLVQRGRGGGLTGALGGMGGQSAFGAKAGDTFTRVTMVTATFWILICMAAIKFLGTDDKFGADLGTGAEVRTPLSGIEDQDAPDAGVGPGTGDAGTGDAGTGDAATGDAGTGDSGADAAAGAGTGVGTLDGGDSAPPQD